jgi:hypothetical protein
MINTNYVISVVRILENPIQTFSTSNILSIKIRAQLPQSYNSRIINLICWDTLARNIYQYYQIHDYIIIEGYLSSNSTLCLNKLFKNSRKMEITVLKIHPFLLN